MAVKHNAVAAKLPAGTGMFFAQYTLMYMGQKNTPVSAGRHLLMKNCEEYLILWSSGYATSLRSRRYAFRKTCQKKPITI